jgi:hypothetical protein
MREQAEIQGQLVVHWMNKLRGMIPIILLMVLFLVYEIS